MNTVEMQELKDEIYREVQNCLRAHYGEIGYTEHVIDDLSGNFDVILDQRIIGQ